MECFKIKLSKIPFEFTFFECVYVRVCVCVWGITAEKIMPIIEQEINSVRLKISGCQSL